MSESDTRTHIYHTGSGTTYSHQLVSTLSLSSSCLNTQILPWSRRHDGCLECQIWNQLWQVFHLQWKPLDISRGASSIIPPVTLPTMLAPMNVCPISNFYLASAWLESLAIFYNEWSIRTGLIFNVILSTNEIYKWSMAQFISMIPALPACILKNPFLTNTLLNILMTKNSNLYAYKNICFISSSYKN